MRQMDVPNRDPNHAGAGAVRGTSPATPWVCGRSPEGWVGCHRRSPARCAGTWSPVTAASMTPTWRTPGLVSRRVGHGSASSPATSSCGWWCRESCSCSGARNRSPDGYALTIRIDRSGMSATRPSIRATTSAATVAWSESLPESCARVEAFGGVSADGKGHPPTFTGSTLTRPGSIRGHATRVMTACRRTLQG